MKAGFIPLLLAVLPAMAAWPTAGGNSLHNGQGSTHGPDAPEVLWQGTTFHTLFGCQIYVWNGYMATMRFQTLNYSPVVVYDLETGEELWDLDLSGPNSRTMPIGFRDGRLYLVNYQESSAGDTIYAYDPASGAQLWKAETLARFGIAHMLSFTEEGDFVIPANEYIFRIDHLTGETVWLTPRFIPNTGADHLCVAGDRIYGFEGFLNTAKTLVAYDTATGARLYETPPLPGDGDQEVPLMADDQGRVYVIRDGTGLIRAYLDTGEAFEFLWTAPTATAAGGIGSTGNFGVGPDGSLYFVGPSGNTLVRLDPETGATLAESPVLAENMDPRITIAPDGTLYVTDGTASGGKLHALTPDLSILWQENFPYNYYSGPALGYDGYLAMTGNGTNLVVYRTGGTGIEPSPGGFTVSPNPVSYTLHLHGVPDGAGVSLFDMTGRKVCSDTGSGSLDVSGLPRGVYTLVVQGNGQPASTRIVVTR